MASAAATTVLGKAIYVVPFAFLAGVTIQEYLESQTKIDEIVEKRVQQRLGVWKAPELGDKVDYITGAGIGIAGRRRDGIRWRFD